jgi:hypothetical protein
MTTRWIPIRQAARLLGLAVADAVALVHWNALEARLVHGKWEVTTDSVTRYLRRTRRPPPGGRAA